MSPENADTLAAISQLYERQLAAKDEALAALWRRVGAAEQARDLYREELAILAAAAAPPAPREDRLFAGPAAVGAWHAGVAVCRVAPGTAERLLQRLQWRLLPRLRRRPGFLAYQLLAVDAETALVVSLWTSRAEAERAGRVAEALLAGPTCAMVVAVATRAAALAPADEGERGRADAGGLPAAAIVAPAAVPSPPHRARTAD